MSVLKFSNLAVDFGRGPLFQNLSAVVSAGITALAGANGIGKSVLLKVLSGNIPPSAGNVHVASAVYRVDQLQLPDGPRIADALRIGALYDSVTRLEQGTGNVDDLDDTAGQWQVLRDYPLMLADAGLHYPLDTPIVALSGGERMRLSLCCAFLHKDHFLLLDEPGNHLDSEGRQWLCRQIRQHDAGVLVVSHDAGLLMLATQIYELTQHGLLSHGSYRDWMLWRERQQLALEQEVNELKKQSRQLTVVHQNNLRKSARRRQQGTKKRRDGSQSKLLLDKKAEQAQRSRAREVELIRRQETMLQETRAQLHARRELLVTQQLVMPCATYGSAVVFTLHEVTLPYDTSDRRISWTVRQGERWRLKGRNGSGKSSLLQMLGGQLPVDNPQGRLCRRVVYLDQHLSLLRAADTAVENLVRLAPGYTETDWRTWLGALRIDADKALLPLCALSGGERLKVALLALTRQQDAPQLLLLDEPDNHLDTESRHLLADSLKQFGGAVVLVSHQQDFVEAVATEFEFSL